MFDLSDTALCDQEVTKVTSWYGNIKLTARLKLVVGEHIISYSIRTFTSIVGTVKEQFLSINLSRGGVYTQLMQNYFHARSETIEVSPVEFVWCLLSISYLPLFLDSPQAYEAL